MTVMRKNAEASLSRFTVPLMDLFGLSRWLATLIVLAVLAILIAAVYWSFHSAPPRTLTMTSGPPGSTFETNAIKYRDILQTHGVTLKIVPSQGSLENLARLKDSKSKVDVGFVQGGVTNAPGNRNPVSLGSVAYQPLLVFSQSANPPRLLSELKGKRLAIGPQGSGTHALAVALLELNGISDTNGPTKFVDVAGEDMANALIEDRVDAVFLMGDSASRQVMRKLLNYPGISLVDFVQAEGYVRKFSYLNKIDMPEGYIDFGKDLPTHTIRLLSPTVELLARPDLHPALSDLLIEAARTVHGVPTMTARKGEFPAPLEHDYPISADASRYYKTGKTWLYSKLPFLLASIVNQILVAFVPILVVVIPGIRLIPALYKWRVRLIINFRYRTLLRLEREVTEELPANQRKDLLTRLAEIEDAVNRMKVPASFGDQFYGLRGHINFVRSRLVDPVNAD